ncbi:hypothetical protein FQN49_007765 [Arthroderma sp. PD_2]|nr:hypothetical protein FQN49_007765 [Arthroderma sp. PD_2]
MPNYSWLSTLVFAFLYTGVAFSQPSGDTDCDASATSDARCIEPESYGSVNFEFKPLFPEEVKFVFAFDADNQSEAEVSTPPKHTKIAYWLEYDYSKVNLDPSAHKETYIGVLVNGNTTGTSGGGNNGCDGLLGAQCSANIEAWVKAEVTSHADTNLEDVFANLEATGKSLSSEGDRLLENLSCPQDILNKYYYRSDNGGAIAVEDVENVSSVWPSGNASYPQFVSVFEDTSYEQQQIAVMLLVRKPTQGDLYKDADNIQFGMACVKTEPFQGSAARLAAWSTAMAWIVALVLGFMLV